MAEKMETYNDIFIKNFDAAKLYWKGYVKPDQENWIKKAQSYLKTKKKFIHKTKNDPDRDKLKEKVDEMKAEIFTFKKNMEMKFEDNRYIYSGAVTDSLMSRKQRSLCQPNEIRKGEKYDFSDLIINLSFSTDLTVPSGDKQKIYDKAKKQIVDTEKDEYRLLINKKELRRMAYRDGITINGIHYVNFQRTSSKARTGNCLFIDERYFEEMNEWQNMGIPFDKMEEVDLVGSRSYTSLTSSSIIGTLDIDPYSILLIDEVVGEYTQECNVVNVEDKHLIINKEEYTQRTEMWDGQSLGDESLFNTGEYVDKKGKRHSYAGKGFLLLRQHFFKSAAFNTKLQKYYKEKGITHVYDRFGNEYKAEQIKIVTTKNSCKIFKFTDVICDYMIQEEKKASLHKLESIGDTKEIKLEKERLVWDWYREKLKADKEVFGVCKYEKESKFGDYQQLWYQVINSLNFSKEELKELVADQVKEINLMKDYPAFFKKHLSLKPTKKAGRTMMLQLLSVNEDISRTKWYKDYLRAYINNMILKIKSGKIQIANSDFCVLVGNPYEMLRASAGEEITSSILKENEAWNSRYEDGEELFGFRSPHITTANCALLSNKKCKEWKWFNFTDRILVINLWEKGSFLTAVFDGSDQDSDTAFCGNNKIILKKVKEAVESGDYLIPINGLSPEASPKKYTNENMAIVDGKLQNDLIGKICNYARDLQSLYWHLYNAGELKDKEKYLPQIYDDICVLEVLSNIAIDNAKRMYPISVFSELNSLKKRDYLKKEGIFIEGEAIYTTETGDRKKLTDDGIKDISEYLKRLEIAETEEERKELNKKIEKALTTKKSNRKQSVFVENINQRNKVKKEGEEYIKLETPMDYLSSVMDEGVKRAKRTKIINIMDILEENKGKKADYNRIEAIKKIAIEGNQKLKEEQVKFNNKEINLEKFVENRANIIEQIIQDMKINRGKERKFTKFEINKLIRDAYGVYTVKGKKIDRRDKKLVENEVCAKIIQWVYEAFPEEFIAAIKENTGKVTRLYEIESEQDVGDKEEVYSLYGKRYIIK